MCIYIFFIFIQLCIYIYIHYTVCLGMGLDFGSPPQAGRKRLSPSGLDNDLVEKPRISTTPLNVTPLTRYCLTVRGYVF